MIIIDILDVKKYNNLTEQTTNHRWRNKLMSNEKIAILNTFEYKKNLTEKPLIKLVDFPTNLKNIEENKNKTAWEIKRMYILNNYKE